VAQLFRVGSEADLLVVILKSGFLSAKTAADVFAQRRPGCQNVNKVNSKVTLHWTWSTRQACRRTCAKRFVARYLRGSTRRERSSSIVNAT